MISSLLALSCALQTLPCWTSMPAKAPANYTDYIYDSSETSLTAPLGQRALRVRPYHPDQPDMTGNGHVTVVFVHGGGWAGGSYEDAFPFFHELLKRQIAIVSVDYRLSQEAVFPA